MPDESVLATDLEWLASALFRVHEDHLTDHDMNCWNCGGPLGEYRPANRITWDTCIARHPETAEGWRRYAAEVQVYLPGLRINAERVRAIFDRDLDRMQSDQEPSDFIAWFEALRDEVLGAVNDGSKEGS
jgi:hypothetical protein